MTTIRGFGFDCFQTIIRLHWSRLPAVEHHGHVLRSTAPALLPILREVGYSGDMYAVHEALVHTWHKAENRRSTTMEETPATERFSWMLENLELDSSSRGLIDELSRIHSDALVGAMSLIAGASSLLRVLNERGFPVGLLSNFDQARTVYSALDTFELTPWFATVVVSAEVGFCKPHEKCFNALSAGLGVASHEVLFVGDQLVADVHGSRSSGMVPVWFREPQSEQAGHGPSSATASSSRTLELPEGWSEDDLRGLKSVTTLDELQKIVVSRPS